ncbi:MAG: hypothetical protein JHC12_06065 [Thermogladius sp.]|nr:hypothetical protein [Thermogladius sp.]
MVATRPGLEGRGRLALYASSLSTLVYGLLLILTLTLPLYYVTGVLEGIVAFSYYRITYYGSLIAVDELDRSSYMAIPLIISAIYMAVSSVNLLTALIEREDYYTPLRLCFTGGLVAVVASSVFMGVYSYYFERAVSSLEVNLNQATSAGILILGGSKLNPLPYTMLLLNPMVHLATGLIPLLSTTVALYLHHTRQHAEAT